MGLSVKSNVSLKIPTVLLCHSVSPTLFLPECSPTTVPLNLCIFTSGIRQNSVWMQIYRSSKWNTYISTEITPRQRGFTKSRCCRFFRAQLKTIWTVRYAERCPLAPTEHLKSVLSFTLLCIVPAQYCHLWCYAKFLVCF